MKFDIDQLKAALPMPSLMEKLGLAENAKRKAKCPWHEDGSPSFSVFQKNNKWFFKCHTGCGSGDEINLIEKHFTLYQGDAIRKYAELAGIAPDDDVTRVVTKGELIRTLHEQLPNDKNKKELMGAIAENFPGAQVIEATEGKTHDGGNDVVTTPAKPKGKPLTLQPLTPAAIQTVATWRGYPVELVQALSDAGQIGTINRKIAFPVAGGFHYREKDGSWRYTQGAGPDLFAPGEIEEGAHINVFESQWDALAHAALDNNELVNLVATRGAQNAKLLKERFANFSGVLYLWPQNDRQHAPATKWPKIEGIATPPSEIWVKTIIDALPEVQIVIAVTPNEFKDMNDWLKAGATAGQRLNAYIDAKPFSVPALDDKTTETNQVSSGEAREGANDKGMALEANIQLAPKSNSRGGENLSTGAAPDKVQVEAPTKVTAPPVETSAGSPVQNQSATAPDAPTADALADILDSISKFLKTYVIFPDEEAQATAIALWVAHCWAYKSFKFTPYLNVCSPEKRCGKTRLLECLQIIVPKPQAFVRPTEAVLFRTIDSIKPTLLLDEIDTVYSKSSDKGNDEKSEGIRAVLNAGFQEGPFAIIPRCVGKDNEPQMFDTFCPKVIAGIGKNLPDTVRDRSIEIRLVRQTEEKKAARFRSENAKQEVQPIIEALDKWSRAAGEALAEARPDMPDQLSDRQQDMMEPLLAIADMAGEDWGDRGRAAMIALGAIAEDASIGVQLLASCRQVFHSTSREKITSNALIGYLIEIEDANAPWATFWEGDFKHGKVHAPARSLARLLEPFGIQPKTIRFKMNGTEETAKGYYKADFADAWKRYLSTVTNEETMEMAF